MADYQFAAGESVPRTAIERWNANIGAIRLLRQLEAEDRAATPEEQAVLARYSGFGDAAFGKAFPVDRRAIGVYSDNEERSAWERRREELESLIGREEVDALRFSRLNAFYTTPEVVSTMWTGLRTMGADDLENIRVLEPSAGSGRFFGFMPEDLADKSERIAVEKDLVTGAVLKRAYPDTQVYVQGFEDTPIPHESIDIAVSNVPFGSFGVDDDSYPNWLTNQSIHNYFFAKTMDLLRPGGVMAYVTSHHTMDAANPRASQFREWMAERGDLVSAVRLPASAFPDTEVVTDILYFRKRFDGEQPGDLGWVETVELDLPNKNRLEVTQSVNRFFVENPQNVLGRQTSTGTMYGGNQYNVEAVEFTPDKLADAVVRTAGTAPRIPTRAEAYAADKALSEREEARATLSSKPEGRFFTGDGGELLQVRNGREAPADISGDAADRVRRMMVLAEGGRTLLQMEGAGADDEEIEALRVSLKEVYDDFKDKYGAVNANYNARLFREDPDSAFVRGLERERLVGYENKVYKSGQRKGQTYEAPVREWDPSDIFTRRLIGGMSQDVQVATAADALIASVNETGGIDFGRMADWLGRPPESVRDELSRDEQIFLNPSTGGWETADRYLAGAVRRKLRDAESAVQAGDERFRGNLAALALAQPEDIGAGDIRARLGAGWVPAWAVNEWAAEQGLTGGGFVYDAAVGNWVMLPSTRSSSVANARWGTDQRQADEIIEAALSGKKINITASDGKGGRVTDHDATQEAQTKVDELRDHFEEWVWADATRGETLAKVYNEKLNDLKAREYSGEHLRFPGMAASWRRDLRKHQRDAIARIVQDGTALIAHEVGFGKSAVLIAAGMERRRMGLSKRPVYVVPNATHIQFRDQFYDLYPNAKLLFPSDADFTPANRRAFLSRMRTGDWDGIILTTEQFQKIPVRPETVKDWQNKRIAEIEEAKLQDLQSGSGERNSITQKQLESQLALARKRIANADKKLAAGRDDGAEYFEDLGIDHLFVDEADRYKNLGYTTMMGAVKGLPQSDAERSQDMFLKTQLLQGGLEGTASQVEARRRMAEEAKAGRFSTKGVVFATGTPVANTIAETWTMMRYLQLEELRKHGLQHFDNWASTYGRMHTGAEATASGRYKVVDRFSKFSNLPELSALFQNVADIRTRGETPEMLLEQPRVLGEGGEDGRIKVVAPMDRPLRAYMKTLHHRADHLPKDRRIDNMLKVLSDGRKASLDIRMVNWPVDGLPDPDNPDERIMEPWPNPEGKIPLMADRAAEVYRRETADRGTQMIFLDLGTPSARDKKDSDDDNPDNDNPGDDALDALGEPVESAEERELLRNVYAVARAELVARGVPENEIAFIHEHDTKAKRKALMERMNSGDVRVLLGSTEKMGVGVNAQERMAAVHHVDVPWRPRDLEQREGRIVRPGNVVYGPQFDPATGEIVDPGRGVQIFNYVQQGSVDGFMWNGIEQKSDSIKAIVRRKVTEREMEDVDELTADAATLKALASDDPMALAMVEAEQRFRGLEREKRTYDRNKATARDRIRAWQGTVERLSATLPTWREDAEAAMAALEDKPADFAMSVGRNTYDKRADANAAIAEAVKALPFKGEWGRLGSYLGWTLYGRNEDQGYRVAVDNPLSVLELKHPAPSVAQDPEKTDFAQRAENILKSLPAITEEQATRLSEAEKGIAVAETEVLKPFRKNLELSEAGRNFARLRDLMLGVAPEKEDVFEIREDETAAEVLAEATEEELDAARREVSEQALVRLRDGKDFKFPTPDEVENAAATLVVQRRREAAAARATELAAADAEFTSAADFSAAPGDPVSQETPKADLEAVAEATAQTVDDALEKDVPVRLTAEAIDSATDAPPSGVIGAAAEEIAEALQDNEGPFAVVVADTTETPEEPAVVAVPGPELDDFTLEEKDEVIDRAADWVADEMERQAEDGGTAVITVADTDAMILQEVKDEVVERDGAVDLPVAEPVKETGPAEPEDDWQPTTKEDRDDVAWDIIGDMSMETRDSFDELEARLGDFLDKYEVAQLAERLGPDPDPDVVAKEEAGLRRMHQLKAGHPDMFGATIAEPSALVSPAPARPRPARTPKARPRPPVERREAAERESRPPLIPVKPTPSGRRLVEAGPSSVKAAARQARDKSPVAAETDPPPARRASRQQRPRDVARGASPGKGKAKKSTADKKLSSLPPLARLALKKHGLR